MAAIIYIREDIYSNINLWVNILLKKYSQGVLKRNVINPNTDRIN